MSLFRRGFVGYLENGDFSDITLVTQDGEGNTREYHLHRLILSYSSEYFRRLLGGDFREATQRRIELGFPDREQVFPLVVRFMYVGRVAISAENAIPLLSMADHYLIAQLKKLCTEYISRNITRENATIILERAVYFQVHDIVDACIDCLAKNFCYITIDPRNFAFMSCDTLLGFFRHAQLAVKDEWPLYQLAVGYLDQHEDLKKDADVVRKLMECVRFRWLAYEQMTEVEANPLVPRELVVEALMARLKQHEASVPPDLDQPTNPRLQRREDPGIECEYTHDFDDKGIIYMVATRGGLEPWENPHNSARIRVTASSIEKGSPADLVSREPSELWTKDVPSSWFTVDLGKSRKALVTHYTLRHGGNYKADSLRTWDLQGSMDASNWTVLRRHNTDKSLNANFASTTWPISPKDGNRPFRYFRILQTARNSNNHNFLVLSGFELYGKLYGGGAGQVLPKRWDES